MFIINRAFSLGNPKLLFTGIPLMRLTLIRFNNTHYGVYR